MFTHSYKGYHIHGYFNKAECRVINLGIFPSYRSAQLAITKALK